MSTGQFTYLSELVDDIKAAGDPMLIAIACRALNELLCHDLAATHDEDIDA